MTRRHPDPLPPRGRASDTGGALAPWVMTPERLDEHLDALDAAGYRPMPLHTLVARLHDRVAAVPDRRDRR